MLQSETRTTTLAEQPMPSLEELHTRFEQWPQCLAPALARTLYALGYEHLQGQRYEKAREYFWPLVANEPKNRSYLAGLALALAGVGEHAGAYQMNTVALYWHPRDGATMLRQAECSLALQNPMEAQIWLDLVINEAAQEAVADDAEWQSLATRASGLRALLNPDLENHHADTP
jgi:predicted Zn-dependent protease